MDQETRHKANELSKEISEVKEVLEKCDQIRERNNSVKIENYFSVIIPEELRESIIMQVECSYKAKLKALEKEFAEL